MMHQIERQELNERPDMHNHIQGLVLGNLPYLGKLGLLSLKWSTQRKGVLARNFQMAKSHGNWEYFLNLLTDEEIIAIYENIIIMRSLYGALPIKTKFMND